MIFFIAIECFMTFSLYTKDVLLSSFVQRFTGGDLFADQ